LISWRTDSAAM